MRYSCSFLLRDLLSRPESTHPFRQYSLRIGTTNIDSREYWNSVMVGQGSIQILGCENQRRSDVTSVSQMFFKQKILDCSSMAGEG
jgi:hypothetical protein